MYCCCCSNASSYVFARVICNTATLIVHHKGGPVTGPGTGKTPLRSLYVCNCILHAFFELLFTLGHTVFRVTPVSRLGLLGGVTVVERIIVVGFLTVSHDVQTELRRQRRHYNVLYGDVKQPKNADKKETVRTDVLNTTACFSRGAFRDTMLI